MFAYSKIMDHLRVIFEWIYKRKLISLLILILLIGGGYSVWYYTQASTGQLSEPIQRGKIIDAVYGIGTVTPNRRFSFNPLIGNTIEKSFVKEGDHVTKGVLLLAKII
jgi:multidrug efflux pump subunit AcrA (membrane-fusion protein)